MYLKKIEIQGFKSFADPVAIEVGDGLTCIIGPNGSGKSNISDAMRWVLGEQSAKTLRGGKMEEIIFAGTDSRRAKSMAEVTLVFDNSSRFLDIDYSEVSIRRRLYRSGESEYFINSNQCRLRDIKDLIMDTGIGVDGYSFIGQGRVDRIVSDKPETRREVFEEAAGIIKYKTRRAEAERKLENAGTNLDRLNDIIIDIESRIDGLREESEKAKEYAELMERYRKLEINITLKNIENMQAKSDQLRDQNARSEAEIEGLKKDKASAEASLQSMRARDEELGRRGDRLRESITENVTKAMEISGEAAKSEERKRASDRDRKRLEEEIAALTAKIESESAVAAGLLENRKALTESMEALTAELAALTSLAAGKGDVYAATVSQIESMRTELFELSREKSVKEIEKDSIENLAENFDAAERRAKEEIAALETSASEISEKLKTVSEVALKKTKERELRSAESETLQSGYDEAVSGLADARAEAERTGLRIEKQASRMRTIEEMESNYEGYAQGVRSAMKAGISGLDGVVAELLQVEKGYEVAIETALGARLQNIICENDEAARKAIGYLKENKAGRLTFLPVTSVRGTVKESGLDAGAPGHLGSALGKVSYDSRYEGVFRYLLGRIVLADTLENAVRLAKKVAGGMSIVTVGGEVISPAGAMTGGTYRHKSANLLERRNEITGLREEIGTLKKRGGELAALISDLDSKASGLLAAIRENDAGRRQAEAEAIRAESEQEQTAAREDELRSAAEKVRKELEDVILERQNSVELISALDMALTKISGDMARLEAEADRASEGVDALKGESETATERVTEIRLKAAETGVAKQNMDQAWDAADMAIADLKAQLSGKESELASIEVEVGSLSAEEAMSALAALERDKAKFTAELEAVTSEKNGLKISVEESDLEAHRLAERLEAAIGHKFGMETELARQDTRVTTWKEKLFD
ncbi:MAG: chromosome segregation protein SMC, partial [Clostridiales Family XIII bacterium]|nr:chromosome segregation protein SMC [Clostridiales Family XIII bacterium]